MVQKKLVYEKQTDKTAGKGIQVTDMMEQGQRFNQKIVLDKMMVAEHGEADEDGLTVFSKKVYQAMCEYMGGDCKIIMQKVQKNNGLELTGLSVFLPKSTISPTIYLEDFYLMYQEGDTFATVMREIIACYERHAGPLPMDVTFYADYKKVQKRLVLKLVNKEKNAELLKEIPYLDFLNLAVIFACDIRNEIFGSGTITVQNPHLAMWGVTIDKLYADARKNMEEQYPCKVRTMYEMISEMYQGHQMTAQEEQELEEMRNEEHRMYVLTNERKIDGAAVLVYENVLTKLGELLNSDYVILPSSIHEVIALPVTDRAEAAALEPMVCDINATQVSLQDVLSDNVYFYERSAGALICL